MGNFYGFFIPKGTLDELGFDTDSDYEIEVQGNSIVISKQGEFSQPELSDDDWDAFSACLEDL